jgi:dTDP-4-dehydrorhamnose 3,5-epimerase
MELTVKRTKLDGVKLITPPTVFEDFRGDYVEIYNRELYQSAGITTEFKQDDYATSRRHVLRGMHGDDRTEKLVKCIYGSLYLVVVQADEASAQFMKWEAFTLSDRNRLQVYVPARYAIGYLVLSETAVFHYKQSAYYHETRQFTVKWNDPRAKIWWPVADTIRSERDF